MRNLLLCTLIFGMGAGASHAQTNDTIQSHRLDGVTVNTELNRTDAEDVHFYPSDNQKYSAQNGIDFLSRMAIPQIKVNLADNNVKTNTCGTVPIYFMDLPECASDGLISHHPLILQNRDFQNSGTSGENILSYNGFSNLNLPRLYCLTATPKAIYNHNRQCYSFISNDSRIINNAEEDNYPLPIMAVGRKAIADVNQLFVYGFVCITCLFVVLAAAPITK